MSASTTVSLTPEIERFINDKVNSGAYPSASDAVNDSLRRIQNQEAMEEAMIQALTQDERDYLRSEVQKGIDSAARGEYTTYSRDELQGYANKVMTETKRRWEAKQAKENK